LEEVITISAVDRMFASVAKKLLGGERDSQKQWISVVRELRRLRMRKNMDDIIVEVE
jgi:hypothetical protein